MNFCLHFVTLFLFVFLSAPVVMGQGQNLPPDILRIKERGQLIVAMYHKDVRPFMFHDQDGQFIGHDVELAKNIAQTLGVELVFDRSSTTFDNIINLVAEEKADLAISLISRTLSRARKVRFSIPYVILRPTLIMNRLIASRYGVNSEDSISSLQTFSGKIGVMAGTSYVTITRNIFPLATIVEYSGWLDAMSSILRQDIDAVLRDEIGVKNYIAEFPEQSIPLQMITLEDDCYLDPLAIALPAGSIQLQEWINLYFDIHGVAGNADNLMEPYRDYYE